MLNIAVILAGGIGSRVGGDLPKQYKSFAGLSLITKSVIRFINHPSIDVVFVVINKNHISYYNDFLNKLSKFYSKDLLKKISPYVLGGKERQNSVYNALQCIAENTKLADPDNNIIIHDAARPFVSESNITNVIKKLNDAQAVVTYIPTYDAVKYYKDDSIVSLDRQKIMLIQTPQGFKYGLISKAHKLAVGKNFSDDSSLLEKVLNYKNVCYISGDCYNQKFSVFENYFTVDAMMKHTT